MSFNEKVQGQLNISAVPVTLLMTSCFGTTRSALQPALPGLVKRCPGIPVGTPSLVTSAHCAFFQSTF